MTKMKYLILILLFFSIISCEKEIFSELNEPKIYNVDSYLFHKIEAGVSLEDLKINDTSKDYLRIGENTKLSIINELFRLDRESNFLYDFYTYFGLPCWECGILEINVLDEAVVASIPFIKNGNLSSVIIFSELENEISIKYLSVENAHEIYLNQDMHQDYNLPMTRLSSYIIELEGRVDTIIGNWIDQMNKSSIDYEKGFQIVIDYQYGLESDIATVIAGSMQFIVSCTGNGGDGNLWPNRVSSITDILQNNTNNGGGIVTSSTLGLSRAEKIDIIIASLNLQEYEDCLSSTEESIIDELVNLVSTNIVNPCNASFNSYDFVENIIINGCPENFDSGLDVGNSNNNTINFNNDQGISYLEIRDQISQVDIIDLTGIRSSKLLCIFNKFSETDNNILCDFTSRFFGNSNSGDLHISDELPLTDGANARVGRMTGTNNIRVRFNRDFLSTTCEIAIMRTLLHELIHVEYRAVENNPLYDNSNFLNVYQNYMEYNSIDHNIMADLYRNRIIEGLSSIYGDQYTDQEYESLSWGGLGPVYVEPIDGDPYYTTSSNATLAWIGLSANEQQAHFENIDYLTNNCEGDEKNICD